MGVRKKASASVEKLYHIEKASIGAGGFATVHRARPKEKGRQTDGEAKGLIPETVAIKCIDKSKVPNLVAIEREVEVMRRIDHPHIIKMYECFNSPKRYYVVMEFLSGRSLFDCICEGGPLSEERAATTFGQLCAALEHMHVRSVIHRDVKPENVLYETGADDAAIKLIDFGTSIITGRGWPPNDSGTPDYVAPEILRAEGLESPASDLWSAGVILYIVLCGFPPFYEEHLPDLFAVIKAARYDFPADSAWSEVSPEAKALVSSLLELDTNRRLTATQAGRVPWIRNAAEMHARFVNGGSGHSRSAAPKFDARGTLRKAAFGIIAQRRMARLMGTLTSDHPPTHTPATQSQSATPSSSPPREASFLNRLAAAELRDEIRGPMPQIPSSQQRHARRVIAASGS